MEQGLGLHAPQATQVQSNGSWMHVKRCRWSLPSRCHRAIARPPGLFGTLPACMDNRFTATVATNHRVRSGGVEETRCCEHFCAHVPVLSSGTQAPGGGELSATVSTEQSSAKSIQPTGWQATPDEGLKPGAMVQTLPGPVASPSCIVSCGFPADSCCWREFLLPAWATTHECRGRLQSQHCVHRAGHPDRESG